MNARIGEFLAYATQRWGQYIPVLLRLYNAVAEALHSRFLRLCGAAVAKVDFARNIFLISEVRENQS